MSFLTARDFTKYPEYADALLALRPTASFGIGYNDYSSLNWQSPEISIPSEDEVKAKLDELMAEYLSGKYKKERYVAYPHLDLQLEMLWDDMNAGRIPGKETSQWFAAVQEVKNNIPKS
jgi:hypothetical protein